MFAVRTVVAMGNDEDSNEPREFNTLIWAFGSALRIGTTAGYNAIGYALLSTSSYVTPALTMGAVATSGAIGAAILSGIGLVTYPCMPATTNPAEQFICGPAYETLDVVIASLMGASIQGLFVSNTTTPLNVATISAAGTATATGALFATIIVVGGTYYCIAELDDDSIVFIPCNTLKKFTCKDLVKPCSLGLSICNRKQMLDLLSKCPRICPSKPKATEAPQSETMTRDGYDTDAQNPDPILYIRRDQIPVALAVNDPQPAVSDNQQRPAEEIEMVSYEGDDQLDKKSAPVMALSLS